ncbi:MAG: hypothetical protein M1831_007381 [Alyxoria varia]|nr:MAG: hypothetical protein M1831_007381 [Alyxoria varia]
MDTNYPYSDKPSRFTSWLFTRLRDIPNIQWDELTPPSHSSYGDWNVWGVLHPENAAPPRAPGSPSYTSSFSSRPSTPSRRSSDRPQSDQLILARVSLHTLTLERQYQLATTHFAETDPSGQHHVRAVQLHRLPPHYDDDPSLVAIIYERPGPNYLRDLISCGPSYYKATNGALETWRPEISASGDFETGKTSLPTFLNFAIGASKCLAMMHLAKRHIHGELRGDSFHYNEETREVKLLHLGSGMRSFERGLTSAGWSSLSRQPGVKYKLQFVAPEQTGRVQYSTDARTDVYSLGILFWNILTGELPFSGSTPLEVMQNALSRRVPALSTKRLHVPDALSAVIQKMVSKNIDDRYHSAIGLKWDLVKINELLSEGDGDSLRSFEIATNDMSSYFVLPDLQLGRDEERSKILNTIDRVVKGKQTHGSGSFRASRNLAHSNSSAELRRDHSAAAPDSNSDAHSVHSRASPAPSEIIPDGVKADDNSSPASSRLLEREEQSLGEAPAGLHHILHKRISTEYSASLGSNDALTRASSLANATEGQNTVLKSGSKYKKKSRCSLITICGATGLGKSSLAQSVHTYARAKGYVAFAKFDPVKSTPFEPVLKLLSSIMRQIFSESDVRTEFHVSLSCFIRPIWSFLYPLLGLPEGLLDATQGKSAEVNPTNALGSCTPCGPAHVAQWGMAGQMSGGFFREEASSKSSRFMAVYLDLLRFIATQKFVLLCLEDTQYADDESLGLVQGILAAQVDIALMLTLRGRDQTSRKVKSVLKMKAPIRTDIELTPLSEEDVSHYVSKTLRRSTEYCFPLIAVIYEKTRGNPLFMREMLDSCYRTNCVFYAWKESKWKFDLDKVFAEFESDSYGSQITDDPLIKRLQELPTSTQSLLAYASLLGNVFSFSMVKALLELDGLDQSGKESDGANNTRPATFIRKSSHEAVRALQSAITTCVIESDERDDQFRFCHDRFQRGARALCPNPEEMDYKIAKLMIEGDLIHESSVYVQAAHICSSARIIRERVPARSAYRAVLSTAADRAIENGGRVAGSDYLSSCILLLQDDPWNDAHPDVSYQETVGVYSKAADSLWLSDKSEFAQDLLDELLQNARDVYDRVSALVLLSRINAWKDDHLKAFQQLKQCLCELGLPTNETSWTECDQRFEKICTQLQATSEEELLDRPLSDDRNFITIGNVLGEALAAAFWTNSLLFYQLSLAQMELHLERGNISQAGLAYVHLASCAIGRFDMVDFSLSRLSTSAERFFDKYQFDRYLIGRGQTLKAVLLGFFEAPMTSLITRLEDALTSCLSADDAPGALVNLGITALVKFWASQDLVDVEAYSEDAAEELIGWQDDFRGGLFLIAVRQLARALQGKTKSTSAFDIFNDSDHDSAAYLQSLKLKSTAAERSLTSYNSMRLIALYLFGHHHEAIAIGESTMASMDENWSNRFVLSNPFFMSLSYIATIREDPERADRQSIMERARAYQKRMTSWGSVNEGNYGIWANILAAELEECDGHFPTSMKHYEAALDLAEIYSMHLEFALCSELFAESMIRRGVKRPAKHAMSDSISAYKRISAFAKAEHLSIKHEWLLMGTTSLNSTDAGCQTDILPTDRPRRKGGDTQSSSPDRAGSSRKNNNKSPKQDVLDGGPESVGLDILDLTNILKSSQLLSSELQSDRLLSNMSQIILDSTGADLCALVIDDEDKGLNVGSITDSGGNHYPNEETLENVEDVVGKQVLLNCLRFKELIFLNNVLDDDRFSNVSDSYRQRNPNGKAIIAMPILRGETDVLGAVYLEGPPHSFTDRNAMVLRLLVNSVGISIKNSLLFKRVEKVSANNAVMIESQRAALSQARDAEKKARLAEAEAFKAVEAKTMFLANVSHELRTPLNGVIGMSELLKGTNLSPEQTEHADSIRVCADTLLTVINDILDFSKLEAGKMQMFSVKLSLHETIHEVVRALSYGNKDKHLETSMELSLAEDLFVMGDPVRLHQILMNLMSNAYKFTQQGKVTIKCDIDVEYENEIEVTFCVADTGVGISREQKKNLFLPFSQADSSTARSYGGTGLGLSICKRIIENVMNGRIWLESEPNKGTHVFFSLKFLKAMNDPKSAKPAEKKDPMSIYSPGNDPEEASSPSNTVDIANIPREEIRVCIAEDNAINAKIARSFVKKIGFKSEAYGDGRQAVDALVQASQKGEPFHVVLMDVQMPVLDGYDATREIRKHPDRAVKNVLILAMTASAIRGDRRKCLDAGMNNYMAKPVRANVLSEMLEAYIAKAPPPLSDDSQDATPLNTNGNPMESKDGEKDNNLLNGGK